MVVVEVDMPSSGEEEKKAFAAARNMDVTNFIVAKAIERRCKYIE